MIIYGTGSFNRREQSLIRDVCPSCSRHGYLKSYTCSRFFTLYFVPVIPLGKFKVTAECPHCKEALGMPHRKWAKLRRTDLARLVSAYEAKPTDAAAAKDALGIIAAVQSRASLLRIGPIVRSSFARDPEILAQLADVYSYLCEDKEADEIYLQAISLSSDEQLAAKANTHIELQKQPKPRPPNRLLQSAPVLIVPALLLIALGTYARKAAASGIEEAYLLSGLSQPYTAVINGEPVTLKPNARMRTDLLVFGKNEIRPGAGSEFIPAHDFEVSVPWYRRPFEKPVVIVNPDQAAVLMWERSGYAYPTAPENAYEYEAHVGKSHHTYQHVDFPFRPFPNSIDAPKDGTVVYRTRVSEFRDDEPEGLVRLLLRSKDQEALAAYLRAKLRSPEPNIDLIRAGSQFLPAPEFLALARPRLALRPVQIEWHRAYQGLLEGTPDGKSLEAEYRELLSREPADSRLAYLLARLMEDTEQAREMFERASKMPDATGYAANALTYYYLLEGDFKRAAEYGDEAVRSDPKNSQFLELRRSAWYGSGNYAALEEETGDVLKKKDANAYAADFYDHLYRLGKMGRVDLARREIQQFVELINKAGTVSESDRRDGTAYLESALCLAAQDKKAFVSAVGILKADAWVFLKSIVAGDLDSALQIAERNPDVVGMQGRLALYVLLMEGSRTEHAATQLAIARAEMAKGPADLRRWAEWFSGAPAPSAIEAAHTCYDMDHHFLYLTALAQKHPDRAGEYLARAAAMKARDSIFSLAVEHVWRDRAKAPVTPTLTKS